MANYKISTDNYKINPNVMQIETMKFLTNDMIGKNLISEGVIDCTNFEDADIMVNGISVIKNFDATGAEVTAKIGAIQSDEILNFKTDIDTISGYKGILIYAKLPLVGNNSNLLTLSKDVSESVRKTGKFASVRTALTKCSHLSSKGKSFIPSAVNAKSEKDICTN